MTTTVPPTRRITQDVGATLTYLDDWTQRLALAYPGQNITIASATGSITTGSLSVDTHTTTSITFTLNVAAVPVSTDVIAKLIATLSNGNVDVRDLTVGAVS